MLETVKTRLSTFGYTVTSTDENLINILIEKVIAEIKLACNISDVPADQKPLVVDIVAGEFLRHKKAIGDDLGDINLEAMAKSVKLGDTTVDFGNASSPESQFDSFMGSLINGNKALLTASLRRLDWS